MDARELISSELVGLREELQSAKARLDQLRAEVDQLAGAVAFAEYILEQTQPVEPAEEVNHDSSSGI